MTQAQASLARSMGASAALGAMLLLCFWLGRCSMPDPVVCDDLVPVPSVIPELTEP